MKSDSIRTFMTLAGQKTGVHPLEATKEERALGAQLLLSEVLEYVIKGLGVIPEIQGVPITEPEGLQYRAMDTKKASPLEMIDGLADVAYTMYWNSEKFRVPLEEAFEMVCANNLEKFVVLKEWSGDLPSNGTLLSPSDWHCHRDITWPKEVTQVRVVVVGETTYAVGTDARGKVRKPSSYTGVDLTPLVGNY